MRAWMRQRLANDRSCFPPRLIQRACNHRHCNVHKCIATMLARICSLRRWRERTALRESRRQRGWFLVLLAPGHHGQRHPGELVGKRDRGDLGLSARRQRGEPGAMPGAMALGIADDRERTGDKQGAQVAITLLADRTEPVLAPTRALPRYEPNPG